MSLLNRQAPQDKELEFEVEYQQFLKSKWKTKYGIKMRAYIGKLG